MTTPDIREDRTVSSEVTVGVDAETAFAVFTDEMDLWWVRGPINFYDASRAIARRCEPGVGGRLLEVYDDATGEALELGRITTWQPGERLAWRSSVDDVITEVRFAPVAGGTSVTVTATIPAGGADRGGTSWVRVVPGWLGAWCARRSTAPHQPTETARLGLALYYTKPPAAARWLADAFGLVPSSPLPDDDADPRRTWIEFRVGNCTVMLFPLSDHGRQGTGTTHMPWVFVDDLDAHLVHTRRAGASIVSDIHQHGYRAYVAADLEGNHWTFAQARPTM